MKRTLGIVAVITILLLSVTHPVWAPPSGGVGIGIRQWNKSGSNYLYPRNSGWNFAVGGTNSNAPAYITSQGVYGLNNSSVYDSGGTPGFAGSGGSWAAFGSGSSSIAGTNISISGDTISVIDNPSFSGDVNITGSADLYVADSGYFGAVAATSFDVHQTLRFTRIAAPPSPFVIVGMIAAATTAWQPAVGHYIVDSDSTWHEIEWYHPLAGTNISYSGDTLSVIDNPSFASTTTLAAAVVMSGEAGTAGWYVKLDGSGNVSLGDPSGGTVNSFVTWNVENGTDPVADSTTDTILIYDGVGITITGDATADSITVAYSGAFSGVSGSISDAQVPDNVTILSTAISGTLTSAQLADDMARDSELHTATVAGDLEVMNLVATGGTVDYLVASDGANGLVWKVDATGTGGIWTDRTTYVEPTNVRDIGASGDRIPYAYASSIDTLYANIGVGDIGTLTSNLVINTVAPIVKFDDTSGSDFDIMGNVGNLYFRDYSGGISTATNIALMNDANSPYGGYFYVYGDADGPGTIGFGEDTDNGADTLRLLGPVALGADIDVSMPSTAGTLALSSELFGGNFSDLAGSISDAQVPTDITIDARTIAQGGTSATTASGARTALGLAIGSDVQAYSANMDTDSTDDYTVGGTDVPVTDGGTGASTLTDGGVLLGSGTGAITPMAVLADSAMIVGDGTTDPVAESGATLRTSIGVGTGDTPQFTGVEVGAATDTTLLRSGAGDLTVEGSAIYRAGGTDVADADIVAAIMRDAEWTAATLTAPGKVELATTTESITGTDATRAVTPDGLTDAMAAASQPLEATLTDIADGTINENLVNTANPWAVNEGGTGAATAAAARAALESPPPMEAFVIAGSSLTTTTYPLIKPSVAITITDIHCITDVGTVIMELEEGTATAYDGGTVVDSVITCDSNGAEDDGALTNGTIAANAWIAARIGTEATSPTILGVTFYYTVD